MRRYRRTTPKVGGLSCAEVLVRHGILLHRVDDRRALAKTTMDRQPSRLFDRLIIITGGSSGIGLEAIKLLQLPQYGSCRLVLACRDEAKVRRIQCQTEVERCFACCVD